ncbi:MAG: universal stress protein [Myxococcales bacterium]
MSVRELMVACDFSEPARRAVRLGLKLGAALEARVSVVYVHSEPYGGRADMEAGLTGAQEGQTERYLRFLELELQRFVHTVDPTAGERVRYLVRRGEPAAQISACANEIGADLLCLGATGKGAMQRVLLGSVSERVLRDSLVPVLVVPSRAGERTDEIAAGESSQGPA